MDKIGRKLFFGAVISWLALIVILFFTDVITADMFLVLICLTIVFLFVEAIVKTVKSIKKRKQIRAEKKKARAESVKVTRKPSPTARTNATKTPRSASYKATRKTTPSRSVEEARGKSGGKVVSEVASRGGNGDAVFESELKPYTYTDYYRQSVKEMLEDFFVLPERIKGENVVVLDASVAKLSVDDLHSLEALKNSRNDLYFRTTNNAYYELRLLADSRLYGYRAKYIINTLCDGRHLDWDIQSLYDFTSEKYNMSNEISQSVLRAYDRSYIFLFCDSLAFDEFVKFAKGAGDDVYYLLLDKTLKPTNVGITRLKYLKEYKQNYNMLDSWLSNNRYKFTSAIDSSNDQPFDANDENAVVYVGKKEYRLKELKKLSTTGSEAIIFESGDNKTLLKVYHNSISSTNRVAKLHWLIQNRSLFPDNVVLPLELVYDSADRVVGFTMKYIQDSCSFENWMTACSLMDDRKESDALKKKIFRKLLLSVLEMRMIGVYVADMSFNNILIDAEEKDSSVTFKAPMFIDCDSFQIASYPGLGITPGFDYPKLNPSDTKKHIREPRHFSFSFFSLVFYSYLNTTDFPWVTIDDERTSENKFWFDYQRNCIKPFPFTETEPMEIKCGPAITNYEFLSEAQRRLFHQEFSFEKPAGYGEIIKAFGWL